MIACTCTLSACLLRCFLMHNRQRSSSDLLLSLIHSIYHHAYSYDMNLRPTILFHEPTFENPVDVFPSATFYQLTGFWPGQFEEICDNLSLLPDAVVCPDTHCRSSKNLAIFLLLRRWNKADTWKDVSQLVHRRRVWCIKIYRAIFNLLAIHYRKLVQAIDYHRIMPLLESWSADMVHFCGCRSNPDDLPATDSAARAQSCSDHPTLPPSRTVRHRHSRLPPAHVPVTL